VRTRINGRDGKAFKSEGRILCVKEVSVSRGKIMGVAKGETLQPRPRLKGRRSSRKKKDYARERGGCLNRGKYPAESEDQKEKGRDKNEKRKKKTP